MLPALHTILPGYSFLLSIPLSIHLLQFQAHRQISSPAKGSRSKPGRSAGKKKKSLILIEVKNDNKTGRIVVKKSPITKKKRFPS